MNMVYSKLPANDGYATFKVQQNKQFELSKPRCINHAERQQRIRNEQAVKNQEAQLKS